MWGRRKQLDPDVVHAAHDGVRVVHCTLSRTNFSSSIIHSTYYLLLLVDVVGGGNGNVGDVVVIPPAPSGERLNTTLFLLLLSKAESVVVLLSDVNELNRSSHDLSQNEIIINSNNNMGGQSDLSLSSHRKDDESFNTKRKELQQFLPQLEQHLTLLSKFLISYC